MSGLAPPWKTWPRPLIGYLVVEVAERHAEDSPIDCHCLSHLICDLGLGLGVDWIVVGGETGAKVGLREASAVCWACLYKYDNHRRFD